MRGRQYQEIIDFIEESGGEWTDSEIQERWSLRDRTDAVVVLMALDERQSFDVYVELPDRSFLLREGPPKDWPKTWPFIFKAIRRRGHEKK